VRAAARLYTRSSHLSGGREDLFSMLGVPALCFKVSTVVWSFRVFLWCVYLSLVGNASLVRWRSEFGLRVSVSSCSPLCGSATKYEMWYLGDHAIGDFSLLPNLQCLVGRLLSVRQT